MKIHLTIDSDCPGILDFIAEVRDVLDSYDSEAYFEIVDA